MPPSSVITTCSANKLQRPLLKPKICYQFSCSIPLLEGYHNLNECERMLVESMRIYPTRFLQIKREIWELRAMLGDNIRNDPRKIGLTPPNWNNITFAPFWKNLIEVIERDKGDGKLYPSPITGASKFFKVIGFLEILEKIYYMLASDQ